MPSSDLDTFSIRLRQVARVLRWSVGLMVLAFVVAWAGASHDSIGLARAGVILGALGFAVATLCFVWLAFQAATRRRGPPAR
jgi:hypothetical protein